MAYTTLDKKTMEDKKNIFFATANINLFKRIISSQTRKIKTI